MSECPECGKFGLHWCVEDPRKAPRPLTLWEAGNVYVKVADCLSNASLELVDFPEHRDLIKGLRVILAERFNRELQDEMGFGL